MFTLISKIINLESFASFERSLLFLSNKEIEIWEIIEFCFKYFCIKWLHLQVLNSWRVTYISELDFEFERLLQFLLGSIRISSKDHSNVHHVFVICLNDFLVEAFRQIFTRQTKSCLIKLKIINLHWAWIYRCKFYIFGTWNNYGFRFACFKSRLLLQIVTCLRRSGVSSCSSSRHWRRNRWSSQRNSPICEICRRHLSKWSHPHSIARHLKLASHQVS